MSYLKYSNMCAEVVRSSLKEPFLTKVRRKARDGCVVHDTLAPFFFFQISPQTLAPWSGLAPTALGFYSPLRQEEYARLGLGDMLFFLERLRRVFFSPLPTPLPAVHHRCFLSQSKAREAVYMKASKFVEGKAQPPVITEVTPSSS